MDENKASRLNRLWAVLVDCLIILPPSMVIGWGLGVFDYDDPSMAPIHIMLITAIASFFIYFAINWNNLKQGQTWGKRALNIKIVGPDGDPLPIKDLLLKRYLFQYGIAYIPVIGGLLSMVDSLFIFGGSKQCLHDKVANTNVVNV
ncbi:RDD family protein [Flagellatimonas centrodinii]|uniref:RDD family protein n=1 Tax=Flagellatimonas centrodinii TaxID=2806210 RepID=UPI001FEFDFF4|nr:RDD family protein [Flagellatimonas centrodinii]ULQ45572.1 RDD family protein [Flagellatimonas centrodinii]